MGELKQLNETLRLVNENLRGIKEELNYLNGVEVLKDGTKINRELWNKINVPSTLRSATDD